LKVFFMVADVGPGRVAARAVGAPGGTVDNTRYATSH
jgi:hypothetical protein